MIDYEAFFSRAAATMQGSAIRRMGTVLSDGRDIVSFAPGYPAPETFPWVEFQEITHDLLSGADGAVLQYGPTRGYRPLLDAIAGIMHSRRVETAVERLLVTTGSQQGLDLVARVLLDPGDVVLVELPTYTGAITAFRNAQALMVGVRQDGETTGGRSGPGGASAGGVSLQDLDDTWQRLRREGRRIRALYVVPNFQNPTGLLIGLAKRQALLEWAERRETLVIEDDPYRDLYFEGSATEADVRPIRADDRQGRVIYLSSFSKTLAPGYRVAWIDAPRQIAVKLEMAKQSADLCTGELDQRVVFEACRRGVLERQLPLLRAHYQRKRDTMVSALRDAFGTELQWPEPRGGFFLWSTLPAGIDAGAMVSRAVAHGVIYVAGGAFFVDGSGNDRVRLSFSAATPERIREGVSRLAATVRAELTSRASQGVIPPPAGRQ